MKTQTKTKISLEEIEIDDNGDGIVWATKKKIGRVIPIKDGLLTIDYEFSFAGTTLGYALLKELKEIHKENLPYQPKYFSLGKEYHLSKGLTKNEFFSGKSTKVRRAVQLYRSEPIIPKEETQEIENDGSL